MLPLLVVDGYNVLHADDTYLALAETDVDVARRRLVDDVTVFASGRYDSVVVFDGGGPDPGPVGRVTVEWSGSRDADALVEALAFEARRAGRLCVVVTTDRATREAVLGRGVEVVSSAAILGHLDEARVEWRESAPRGKRVTLAEMLDPAVRSRLERIARGETDTDR